MRVVLSILPEEATRVVAHLTGHCDPRDAHLTRGLAYIRNTLAHELARAGHLTSPCTKKDRQP